ncbi:MAG TPA: hypothetical protein VKH81_23405 [Candidatus Angelobacter sp.]|nr:hypothetical protein [Candidatus Angelobacter sp.]
MSKLGFLLLLLPVLAPAQVDNQDIFTITVASPTSPRDVQVRYFLSGDSAVQQAGSIARPNDNQIVIKTGVEDKSARGFRAIVFSPGCELGTISADNLASSTRKADFECQKLASSSLHGKTDLAEFAGKQLQVETLYQCNWAGQFFGVSGLEISPFSVAKAKVESDGSFAVDLPDFTSDPLWGHLSHNATLMFVLVDAANGERLATLSAPSDLSRRGALKIAHSYPAEIPFTVRSQSR